MASGNNDKLFKVRVTKDKAEKVKVYYVGYSNKNDKWKRKEDLVILDDDDKDDNVVDAVTLYVPYSLSQVLGNKIKLSQNSGRKVDPSVWINIPLDEVTLKENPKRAFRSPDSGITSKCCDLHVKCNPFIILVTISYIVHLNL